VALGKPVGGDLREGKMTLPVIHLLHRGGERASELIRRIADARAATLEEWRELCGLLVQARSIDYAQRVAMEFVQRAKNALYAFPASDARDALMFLPDYVISRDR
jgi:octaprenyl-diphosphate synthase